MRAGALKIGALKNTDLSLLLAYARLPENPLLRGRGEFLQTWADDRTTSASGLTQ